MRGKVGIIAAGVAVCATLAAVAQAGPSDSDPTFGGQGGVRFLSIPGPYSGHFGLALRADGQIAAAGAAGGPFTVPLAARHEPTGEPVMGFGSGGYVTTPSTTASLDARSVAFAGDNLVTAGELRAQNPPDSTRPYKSSLVIERLEPDGDLDPTFNPGGPIPGRLVTRLGFAEAAGRSVLVLPDGKIVVAGFYYPEGSAESRGFVACFNSDGSLDTTFNPGLSAGVRAVPYSGIGSLVALALDGQGRLLAAGTLRLPGPPEQGRAMAVRLHPDGTFDESFASDATIKGAKVFVAAAGADTVVHALAVDPADRAVIAGSSDSPGPGPHAFVARLTSSGALDSAFSDDGRVTQVFETAARSVATAVAVDPGGAVTIAGSVTLAGLERILLGRFTAAGAPDTGFSSGGNLVATAIGTGEDAFAGALRRTPSGKLLLAGRARESGVAKAFLARFGTDGAPPIASFVATWPSLSETGETRPLRPGQTATFDASGSSDPDGTLVEREWDLDGDGTFETSGSTVQKAFEAPGDHGVTLRVADDDGLTSIAAQMLRVRENEPPAAQPGLPSPHRLVARQHDMGFALGPLQQEGLATPADLLSDPSAREFAPVTLRKYAFSAAPSFDRDGKPVAYRWALDRDGEYGAWRPDPEIEHYFVVPGPRTLRLQVRDDEGAVSTWQTAVDLPAPQYSVKAVTESGEPHPGIVLRPNGPAQTLVLRTSVKHAGALNSNLLRKAELTNVQPLAGLDLSGVTVKRESLGTGLIRLTFTAAGNLTHSSGRVRLSTKVASGFAMDALDRATGGIDSTEVAAEVPFHIVPRIQLAVNGLEVTQGVQKFDPVHGAFHSIGLRGDPMPYEGVKLAENKDTWVRLYAINFLHGDVKGVTATLHGRRGGKTLPGSPLLPVKPAEAVRFGYPSGTKSQLDDVNGSFWFRLPYSWTKRDTKIELRGAITPPHEEAVGGGSCPAGGCAADNDLTVTGVPFRATPRLKLRMLYFHLGDGAAKGFPGGGILHAQDVYPIDPARIEVLPGGLSADASDVFDTEDEDRSTELRLHDLTREIAESLVDDPSVHPHGVVIGLHPMIGELDRAVSYGSLRLPWAIPGAITLSARSSWVLAHELGHVFEQEHASDCIRSEDGTTEMHAPPEHAVHPARAWPPDGFGRFHGYAYSTLPGTGVARSRPDMPMHDVMSYCERGIGALSPRNWNIVGDIMEQVLLGKPGKPTPGHGYPGDTEIASAARKRSDHDHRAVLVYERGRRAGVSQVQGPAVGVLATLDASGAPSESKSFPLPPGHQVVPDADPAYAAVARAADGTVVGRAPVEILPGEVHGGPVRSELRTIVPAGGATSVEVQRDGTPVTTITASPTAPEVRIIAPRRGATLPKRGLVKLRARVTDPDGAPVTVRADWAADGKRFRPVSTRTTAAGMVELRVPAKLVAGTRSGALRVRAHDGFRSGEAVVRGLRAAGAKPAISVFGGPFDAAAGAVLEPRVRVLDDRGEAIPAKRIEWRLGRRKLGRGERVRLAGLRPGLHVVSVTASDGRGGKATRRVRVRVRPAAPAFLGLRVPAKVGRKARFIRVRTGSSLPAVLRAGRHSFKRVGRRPRSFRIPIARGRAPIALKLTLVAGRQRSSVTRIISRG